MLAAMLDYPFASLVTAIEVLDGKKLKITREIEGGNKEVNEIDLPCVLSVQTGINEPRYVGMRGIRQVASVPIPTFGAAELDIDPGAVGQDAAKVKRLDYFVPALGKGAEVMKGSREQNIDELIGLLQSQRRVAIMARIFAYIEHRSGTANDSALELAAAARKIDATASPTAIVTGWGADLDAVSTALGPSYGQVWKIAKEALAYPNAELVRKALVSVLPHDSILLVPHTHFGIDLGPGLSIKLNSAYVSDVLAIEGVEGACLKVIRQEFGGQVSAHVRCDISSGAVITIRPGAFKPVESAAAGGQVVDKSSEVGDSGGRKAVSRDDRRRAR